MRKAIIFLFLIPIFAHAQINRSARELAEENIETYLKKIYRDQPHYIASLGEPQIYQSNSINADWIITCTVGVGNKEEKKDIGRNGNFSNFMFYLNRKMQVVSAEAYKPATK